ncbi:hypothetical protein [Burkholderia cepacia]|uniref:hypothetical protein n=1 Tax=Burkholderia cepacia TaxID=292 RepID=UPI001C935B9D|nr:hypothetical protein [Burkholderia cepacia]MBY4710568.1 hypothetical protein [Burkholderia cepacia]MBY4734928.1 hypothetical protein [Burkholderia cepacia]MBY4763536.1 hypothetical protein [Burkholderia cepacia]MBY4772957.1 hypothetical protein [Burkholderia cepacia]MBY4899624.1 hypothetical protein [Burkholderia cepacia]
MTTEREVLVNRSEARQECLRPPRQSKAAHASLEFALGRMTVLGAAAHARSRSDENMLTLASYGSVTILSGAEHSLEEALGRGLATPLPKQDTVFVDGAPNRGRRATSRRFPRGARLCPGQCRLGMIRWAKLAPNLSYRRRTNLVTGEHAVFEQQLFA